MHTTTDYKRRLDILSCRLILAYLEPDAMTRAAYVWAVRDESDLPSDAFDMADWTAMNAANTWTTAYARTKARNLLLEKLDELMAAA